MLSTIKRAATVAISAAAILGSAHASPAAAASCATLAATLNDWFIKKPNGPGNYSVLAKMVQIRSDGSFAAYSEGDISGTAGRGLPLTYHPEVPGLSGSPAYVSDPPGVTGGPDGMTTYFSNRRYLDPCSGFACTAPFDPSNVAHLGIRVYLQNWTFRYVIHPFSVNAGDVWLTTYSPGSASDLTLNLCTVNSALNGGLIFNTVPATGGASLIGVDLVESYSPNSMPNVRHR